MRVVGVRPRFGEVIRIDDREIAAARSETSWAMLAMRFPRRFIPAYLGKTYLGANRRAACIVVDPRELFARGPAGAMAGRRS
jgi:hypothetical protein